MIANRDLKIQGRGRRTTSTRFFGYSQIIDFPENVILPFLLEKLALLPLVEKVTPSPDKKW